jgi:AraC-like DNA-binding protein
MPKLDMHRPEIWRQLAPQCGYSARELAKRADASREHLERWSRHLFGTSPQKLFDELRMRAAPAVLEREQSVKAAAFALGFKQPSHFSRSFKAFFRISPRKYLCLPDEKKLDVQRAQENGRRSRR